MGQIQAQSNISFRRSQIVFNVLEKQLISLSYSLDQNWNRLLFFFTVLLELFNIDRTMETLMEPPNISQQILSKLGYDFIRRYEMKQQFSVSQFKADINHLISQLRLYSYSIRQIRLMPTIQSQFLDQKFHEIVFRVMQCIAKLPEKIQIHSIKQDNTIKLYQSTCQICACNLNAKKIKSLQRQIFEYFPIVSRDQNDDRELYQQQQQKSYDTSISNQQLIVKKMLKLQRNLSEKQSELVRSIQQFQNFRNNLLVGLPKNNDFKEGFGKFNSRQYVFQLSSHFFNNIQHLEGKIANLKTVCKKTTQQSTQCSRKEKTENDNIKPPDPIKLANLRAQSQARKLTEVKNKYEQTIKRYQIQIKHLNNQINQLEEQNRNIKQDLYIEKFKKRSRQKSKPILINNNQDRQKKLNQSSRFSQTTGLPIELQIANQLISQIGERKSQIQSCGSQIQQVFPLIKATFKRTIDSFLNQRWSTTNDKRRVGIVEDSEGEESNMSISIKKGRRSSFKGARGSYFKKELNRFNSNLKYQNIPTFTITNQLTYKIEGTLKRLSKNIKSKDQFINNTVQNFFSKTAGKSLYKRSTLQTEVNTLSRKLHVKLSSISSQHKQNSTNGNFQNRNSQLYTQSYESNKIIKQKKEVIVNIDQKQFSQLLSSEDKKFKYLRHQKNNKSADLLSLFNKKSQKNIQKIQDSITIKALNNNTIQPRIMSAFFKPQLLKESKNNSQINLSQTNQNWKKIFKKNDCNTTLYKSNSKKNKIKKEILRLDQLSFLTVFFSMMAKAHLSNPVLYSQLKKCIFESSNKIIKQGRSDEMIKHLMGDILLKHRKCKQSSQYLCQHLTQFLNIFQTCICST